MASWEWPVKTVFYVAVFAFWVHALSYAAGYVVPWYAAVAVFTLFMHVSETVRIRKERAEAAARERKLNSELYELWKRLDIAETRIEWLRSSPEPESDEP